MATSKLSKAAMVQRGYGQVEPNHLSAIRNGQIYAQLPAKSDIKVLENGMFAKYNYADGVVDFDKDKGGEWMLVYNEVKVYRAGETDADFAMVADDYNAYVYNAAGEMMKGVTRKSSGDYGYDLTSATRMVPRLFKTSVGDIFTTNTVNSNYSDLNVGDKLQVDTDATEGEKGYLKKVDSEPVDTDGPVWAVVKKYTLPDGQQAVKLQRIA